MWMNLELWCFSMLNMSYFINENKRSWDISRRRTLTSNYDFRYSTRNCTRRIKDICSNKNVKNHALKYFKDCDIIFLFKFSSFVFFPILSFSILSHIIQTHVQKWKARWNFLNGNSIESDRFCFPFCHVHGKVQKEEISLFRYIMKQLHFLEKDTFLLHFWLMLTVLNTLFPRNGCQNIAFFFRLCFKSTFFKNHCFYSHFFMLVMWKCTFLKTFFLVTLFSWVMFLLHFFDALFPKWLKPIFLNHLLP